MRFVLSIVGASWLNGIHSKSIFNTRVCETREKWQNGQKWPQYGMHNKGILRTFLYGISPT